MDFFLVGTLYMDSMHMINEFNYFKKKQYTHAYIVTIN